MTTISTKDYLEDYLLLNNALKNNKIDKKPLEVTERLKHLIAHFPFTSMDCKTIEMLCHAVEFRLTAMALNEGLYFRVLKQLAVISGAGIAGLAASFELRARGFNVVIVEKRKKFSRSNIINLNVETQFFLKKFNLLEQFETFAASRIQEHRYVLIEKNKSAKLLQVSDVSRLQLDESLSFEPKNFSKFFDHDGIYSIKIKALQSFLAKNALKAGVNIFGDATVRILSRTQEGGVSKIQIAANRKLKPDLFFIAEGTHSMTALELDMKKKNVITPCTGENWVFGNMTYSGKETFVISLIDASDETLQIANVIFNAKSRAINIAVTSSQRADKNSIQELIVQTAQKVFNQKAFPLEKMHSTLSRTVLKPVQIVNQSCVRFSKENVFCIGDSAGSSSPLAGLGGTLGLTLVPLTIQQLLDDYATQSREMHKNFNEFSEAYTSRWIEKSSKIKEFCISLFDKERHSN